MYTNVNGNGGTHGPYVPPPHQVMQFTYPPNYCGGGVVLVGFTGLLGGILGALLVPFRFLRRCLVLLGLVRFWFMWLGFAGWP